MSLGYELFLRGAAALDEEMLEAAARAVAEQGAALRWERYQEQGVTRGLDIIADLEQPGAGALLCRAAFEIAAAQGLTVFDPQLGRPVMQGDEESIAAQVERVHAFIEAAPLGAGDSRWNASTRLWLVVGLLLVGTLGLARGLSCLAR